MTNPSRRQFIGRLAAAAAALAGGVVPLARAAKSAAAPDHLAASDPAAQAVGYVEDSATVDPAKEPAFEKGANCAQCALYLQSQEKDGYAPCAAIKDRRVSAKGWCRLYASI